MDQRYFERWYVLQFLQNSRCLCICECGKIKTVDSRNLLGGKSKSCGCLRKELHTTHGMSREGSREYSCWLAIRQRCLNPNDPRFKDYGGRGISLCERWLDFENFLKDMGPRPAGCSIDRSDNSLGYQPDNCRWATRKQQQNNTRRCVVLTFGGESMTATQWAERIGIKPHTLLTRIKRGWSTEKALREKADAK